MGQLKLRPELHDLGRFTAKKLGCKIVVNLGRIEDGMPVIPLPKSKGQQEETITINYDPRCSSPDYALAHDFAKYIRVSTAPKDKQMMAIPTEKTLKRAVGQLQRELKKTDGSDPFNGEELKTFYLSLLGQLVNTPGNFWITKWLYKRYPKLKNESLKELRRIFSPKEIQIKLGNARQFPNTYLKALNALDAVYALFLDELIGKIRFFKPYMGTEYEALAVQLLAFNKKDKGYGGDNDVINNWAKALGLEGWFEWKKS